MKTHFLYASVAFIFCMCTKPQTHTNTLKDVNLEKLELLSPYLKYDNNNKLCFDWRNLNADVSILRILPKDTLQPENDFCVIVRKFRIRLGNCSDDYDNNIAIRYVDNKFFIYRHCKKNEPFANIMSISTEDKFKEYIQNYKGKYVPWDDLKKLLSDKEEIFGCNNKADSIEFLVIPNEKNDIFLRYYSMFPYNCVLPMGLPFDTVINYPLKKLVSRF